MPRAAARSPELILPSFSLSRMFRRFWSASADSISETDKTLPPKYFKIYLIRL